MSSELRRRYIDSIKYWTTADIKKALVQHQISSNGNKQQLVLRLQKYYSTYDADLQSDRSDSEEGDQQQGVESSLRPQPAQQEDNSPTTPTPPNSTAGPATGSQSLGTQQIGATPSTGMSGGGDNSLTHSRPATTEAARTHNTALALLDLAGGSQQINYEIPASQPIPTQPTNLHVGQTQALGPSQSPVPVHSHSMVSHSQGGTTPHNVSRLTWSDQISQAQGVASLHSPPLLDRSSNYSPHGIQSSHYSQQPCYPMMPQSHYMHPIHTHVGFNLTGGTPPITSQVHAPMFMHSHATYHTQTTDSSAGRINPNTRSLSTPMHAPNHAQQSVAHSHALMYSQHSDLQSQGTVTGGITTNPHLHGHPQVQFSGIHSPHAVSSQGGIIRIPDSQEVRQNAYPLPPSASTNQPTSSQYSDTHSGAISRSQYSGVLPTSSQSGGNNPNIGLSAVNIDAPSSSQQVSTRTHLFSQQHAFNAARSHVDQVPVSHSRLEVSRHQTHDSQPVYASVQANAQFAVHREATSNLKSNSVFSHHSTGLATQQPPAHSTPPLIQQPIQLTPGQYAHSSRGATPHLSHSVASQSHMSVDTHARQLPGNSEVHQTPKLSNHGNGLNTLPTVTPNLASTRLDAHSTQVPMASSNPQDELSALEMELQILQTRDRIRDYQFRLTKSPEELFNASSGVTTDLNSASMLQLVKQSVDLHSLPPAKPFKFSGDYTDYPKWRTLFDLMIEGKSLLPHQKLIYLEEYLTGEPLKLIKGYHSANTSEAYQLARRNLEEIYGDPVDICEAFRDKLEFWPQISKNDAKSLRLYSEFLSQCLLTMSSVTELSKLNDPRDMKRLPHVLPDHLISKWSTKAGNIKYRKEEVTFRDYVEFIKKESFLANSNTTSVNAFMKSSSKSTSQKKSPQNQSMKNDATALSTQTEESGSKNQKSTDHKQSGKPKVICHHCGSADSHNTSDCFQLRKLSDSDLLEWIKKEFLCFRCLRKGHGKSKCKVKLECKKKGCGKNHATCFHDSQKTQLEKDAKKTQPQHNSQRKSSSTTSSSKEETPTPTTTPTTDTDGVCLSTHSEEPSQLTTMIIPVYVSSPRQPEQETLVYAMVDTMANTSFISADLASSLDIDSTPLPIRMNTMTARNEIVQVRRLNHLRVRGMNSQEIVVVPRAYTQNYIHGVRSHIPTPDTAQRWPHLSHLADKICPLQACEIKLLIGYDCPAASCPLTTVRGEKHEPYGVETALGWSIIGGVISGMDQLFISHRISAEEILPDDVLNRLEEDLTVSHTDKPMSQNDFLFLRKMKESVAVVDGFYTMPLPFKQTPNIPDNRSYAMKRFKGLERKLKADPALEQKYREFMTEIIEKGEAQVCNSADPGWYIPHHGVFNPNKPGKLRVVFDCSAVYQGNSLNKLLLSGPDLNNNLAGLLCRFRKEKIAVTCDVKKMFHQFRVAQEHRKFIRFLWYKEDSNEVIDYQMNVHLFGATSSPSCAIFGLQQLAKDHSTEYPGPASFIHQNFYVDDGLISLPTAKEVISLVNDTVDLMKKGNLILHKFLSNDPEVAEALGCDGPLTKDMSSSSSETTVNRALGLIWDINADCFSFTANLESKPLTRRGILSTTAAIFDPLGFLAPFTLKGKLVLQRMCSDGMSWDDPLSEDQLLDWNAWTSCLPDLSDMKIPRCYLDTDRSGEYQTELHVFSDASTAAYGVAAYVRVIYSDLDDVKTSLVLGKSRVTPRKATTIPRLELQAATLAVKVGDFLQHELHYDGLQTFYWTDSETVLGYISNETRKFHTFVANRVQRIIDTSSPTQWNHITTAENPADVASRGATVSKLPSLWFHGPHFLLDSSYTVPESQTNALNYPLKSDDPEVRQVFALAVDVSDSSFVDLISLLESCSSWRQVTRIMSQFLQFLKALSRYREVDVSSRSEKVFTVILRLLQKHYLSEEVNQLSAGVPLAKSSPLSKLDPFIDDHGVLRVGGRISDSLHSFAVRHPAVMPRKSTVTKLYAAFKHAECAHAGRLTTVNHIRSDGVFLYSQGNRLISSLIHNCVQCSKLRGKTLTQKMADLPAERLLPEPPFTHCGMDVFGPFSCKEGRKELKRYGLIFCCLASRAVHLELLNDLSTDCFINSFRCFTSLRGPVKSILSDRGTNFVGASNDMAKALDEMIDSPAKDYLKSKCCTFRFNVPSASHMGGSWERLIRTVRDVMKGILIDKYIPHLDTSGLRTLLYECMAIVNSRPLTTTQLTHDSTVEPLPLSPNMILTMKNDGATAPPGVFTEPDLYTRKRWRRIQYLAEQFWSRWKIEYLQSLQTRQKWNRPQRNLAQGDVVLLSDDDTPRSQWRMALVSEVYPSKDNLVRKVRLHLGEGRYLDRPVHKLVLLVPTPKSALEN